MDEKIFTFRITPKEREQLQELSDFHDRTGASMLRQLIQNAYRDFVISTSCLTVTRQAKRLNVSIKGEGRKETVELVAGKREHDKQTNGMLGNMKNMIGLGQQK